MIAVNIGNNLNRETKFLDENTPLRKALSDAGVDYTKGITTLDGAALKPGDVNKTFRDFGLDGSEGKDKCFLLNVVKTDNASS